MKNINGLIELHGIHPTVRIPSVVLYNFKNPRPLSFPRLRPCMLSTELRHAQGHANVVLYDLGECQQITFC